MGVTEHTPCRFPVNTSCVEHRALSAPLCRRTTSDRRDRDRSGEPRTPRRLDASSPPPKSRRMHPNRRQGRRPIVTLLQSSANDTLEVRSPRREPDTSGLVSTDLVRVYLNTIGKTALLTAEQEVELAKRIEAGLYAERLLAERQLTPALQIGR